MDFTKKDEASDIINILLWRSGDGKTRDLTYQRDDASVLPQSLTRSTMSMGILADEDIIPDINHEELVLAVEEFGHLVSSV